MDNQVLDHFQLFKHPSRMKKHKRKGRGVSSGQGHRCGRGQTGQKSRSGASVHPRFEGGQTPLVRHLPKMDGFRSLKSYEALVFNIATFSELASGTKVNLSFLLENGFMRKTRQIKVKILGNGELSIPLHFTAHAFSNSAREKIESAGGSCEVVE